jgi:predicted NBD/HSP70 family sugar kinase
MSADGGRRNSANGPGEILAMIRRGDVSTRAEVGEATGLSRVTVAQRVDSLLAAGLVREEGAGVSTGGRRPTLLRFDVDRAVVLAASVDTTHTRVAVLNLKGLVLHEVALTAYISDGPEAVLKSIAQAFLEVLAAVGRSPREVEGVGISLPAPIDPQTGRPSQPPIMPGWDDFPVGEHIRLVIDAPVLVENDANAMAAGEQTAEPSDGRPLCLVKVSTGIGAGIVIGGHVYTGSDGGAGDIGHVRLHGENAVCQCGSHGCLAAVASGRAVAGQLTAKGIPAGHGRDVADLLAAGDVEAQALVRAAGRRVGEVLATVVCVLNPAELVVAGDLASPSLLTGLREGLYPNSLPRATRNLDVRLTRLGESAALVGLTRLVVDHVLSAEAVDARLRG